MTDDLVEWLRKEATYLEGVDGADSSYVFRYRQAAARIERLAAFNDKLVAEFSVSRTDELQRDLAKALSDIERLRAALRGVITIADRNCPEFRAARAALEEKDD